MRFLIFILSLVEAQKCVSFDWYSQYECKNHSVSFGANQCTPGKLQVSGPHGDFTFKSSFLECAGLGCRWKCWDTTDCSGSWDLCIYNTSLLPCLSICQEYNMPLWKVLFNDELLYSWKGQIQPDSLQFMNF